MFLEITQNSRENTCAKVPFFNNKKKTCNFIEKETLEQVFSCEFCEISKYTFLQNTSGRLLLIFEEIVIDMLYLHIFLVTMHEIDTVAEVHLELFQTYMIEFFCENSYSFCLLTRI